MAPEVAEVERALLALPLRERAAVIERGLLSLDGEPAEDTQDEIDAAWRDEIGSRVDDVLAGKVELVSGEESRARVLALLAELHR